MTIIINNKCGSYSREVASMENAEAIIREEVKSRSLSSLYATEN